MDELVEILAKALAADGGHDDWAALPEDDRAAHYSGKGGGTFDCKDDYREGARAALRAIESSATHRVVPVELTEAMCAAGDDDHYGMPPEEVWSAMLAASPKVST